MLLVGGLFGLFFGLILGATLLLLVGASLAALGLFASIIGPIAALIAPLVGPITVSTAVVAGGLAVLIATIIAYVLAAVSLLGAIPAPPPAPAALPTNLLELFMRGFIIGLTSSVNFLVWAVVFGSPVLATVFLVINFLAAVPGVSGSRFIYQPVLGFASWFLPMSYLVTPLGILLFFLNLPSVLGTFGLAALRFDFLTATIETTGGALVGLLIASGPSPGTLGFNLGNFTFLAPPAPGFPLSSRQTFFFSVGTAPAGLSAHEAGHTVTVAAFGGFYGWINAVDENIPPPGRDGLAYGELVPESHFFGTGGPFVAVW
jgi:hypothetical protein